MSIDLAQSRLSQAAVPPPLPALEIRVRRAASEVREPWSVWHLVVALGLVTFCVLVMRETWHDMFRIAVNDSEASHVLLVPVAVAWLLWVRRNRIRRCRPGPALIGPILLGVGWALNSIGYRQQIISFWHLGAVVFAVGGLLTVVGKDVLFKFLPVFGVLVFLVPVPTTGRLLVAVPLQTTTAKATTEILDRIGVTGVVQEGASIRVNDQKMHIAEECNGMRLVFTLMMSCYIFAFITPLQMYVRALIILLSPVVAIVCNVIRLVPTVYVYGYYGSDLGKQFHDISGWVMLGVSFLLLLSVIRVLRWALLPVGPYTLASS